MRHKLYLQYNQASTGGERDCSGFRSTAYITTNFTGLTRSAGEGFFPDGESIDVTEEQYNAERLILVIVRHTNGDSFGTSHGHHHVQAVLSDENEALKLAEDIKSGKFLKNNPGKYFPWNGWPSYVEDVEVHSFRVTTSNGDGNTKIQYHN